MASTRAIAIAATSLLAVLAAVIIATSAGSDNATRSEGGTSTAGAPTATASTPPSTMPSTTSKTGTPTRTPTSGPDAAATEPTATATADPGQVSEILPTQAGEPSPTGYSLPPVPRTTRAPLVGGTVPEPATARRRLVKGFPEALVPPRGTKIESSSVSVASNVVQAALVVTGGEPLAILAHYRDMLSTRGFAERRIQGVENAPAAAFAKGRDNVTVTTVDGKTYLLANLRAS